MDKVILSEINRIREIMGMSLIMEAAGPGKGILDLIFGAAGKSGDDFAEALSKNVDDISDPFMKDVIENIKSSVDNNISEFAGKTEDEVLDDLNAIFRGESRPLTGLDYLLKRIETSILDNPDLSKKYLDKLLDTYPSVTNLIDNVETKANLNSLKDEFPLTFESDFKNYIDDITEELKAVGVSETAIDKIVKKIKDEYKVSSADNLVDDAQYEYAGLGDATEDLSDEISSEITNFVNRNKDIYQGWETLTPKELSDFKVIEFNKLKNEIFNGGLAELTDLQQAKLSWFFKQNYINKDLYTKLLNTSSPSFATLNKAYESFKNSTTKDDFLKFFEKNYGNEFSKYSNWKLLPIKSKQWFLRNLFDFKKGKWGTTLTYWAMILLCPTLGAVLQVVTSGAGEVNKEAKQAFLSNKDNRNRLFNEFFTDPGEEINVHTSDGSVDGYALSSDDRNKTYSQTPPEIQSVLGYMPETGAAVLETKTPVYFQGVEYKYFVLDYTLGTGLAKKFEDYTTELDAYLTNPLLSSTAKTEEKTGAYKDELESFKTWYVSRGEEYKGADMSAAGKDDNGYYLTPESTKRYTIKPDFSGFDKK
jgi:hypothetical protein